MWLNTIVNTPTGELENKCIEVKLVMVKRDNFIPFYNNSYKIWEIG